MSAASAGIRTLPHSLEAEQYLLGCCLLDPADILPRCLEKKLTPEAFYDRAHCTIFEVLMSMTNTARRVDYSITYAVLCEELQKRQLLEEVGGMDYVTNLAQRIETTAHANYFLATIRDNYLLRRLISTASQTIEKCHQYNEDGLDHLLDEVEREFLNIQQDRITDQARNAGAIVPDTVQTIHKILERKGEISGLSTGFTELDKNTFGLHPQELIILAARPSMGKTSLAMNMVENVVLPKRQRQTPGNVLVFSLEMSAEQLILRMLCGRARVSSFKLRDGFVSKEQQQALAEAARELQQAPLWIDDSGQINILELRAKARRVHSQHPLSLIVVDYLQLISGIDNRVQREQQIAEISRGLKALAKELAVPVIVLSQLNRESEKEKRQPKLSDLRESGSIEQDADLVLLLARPRDAEDNFSVATNMAEVIIAKQRNGPVGQFRLTFLQEITRFENYIESSNP